MFQNKSFNLSGFLSKSKQNSRISSVIQPSNHDTQHHQKIINSLQSQNKNLKSQLEESRFELQSLKQLLISTKIQYDTEIRAYDELIEQLRNQLSDKDSLLQKCALTFKQNFNQNPPILQIQEINEQQDDQKQSNQENCQNRQNLKHKQISQLLLQSTFSLKEKYQGSLNELQNLRVQCERLKQQIQTLKQKSNMNLMMTNDVSFSGKTGSRISFDFGDIAAELQQIQQIAEFKLEHNPKEIDQKEIQIRQERIQNLQRQNFELQHQIASKSHKLARIFNAAFQYGGMELLDYLQNSIGLVEMRIAENQL